MFTPESRLQNSRNVIPYDREWPMSVGCHRLICGMAKIIFAQIRTIDKIRLVKKLGSLSPKTAR